MANIVPRSEGLVAPDVFLNLRSELRDVVTPLLDGVSPLEDGIPVGMELIQAISAIRALPLDQKDKVKIIAVALGSIANEIAEDFVVIYPDEV